MHQGHALLLAVFCEFLRALAKRERVLLVDWKEKMLSPAFFQRVDETTACAGDSIGDAGRSQRGGDFNRASFDTALFKLRKDL